MRCDLEDVPNGTVFQSDICIIGAGIAGLILAAKMAASGKKVHLLEAGGPKSEDRSQALYEGKMLGVPHKGTTEGRFRTYGGSSTRWAAQLLPYPQELFRARQAVGNIAWPITESDVAGYYPEIQRIMGANKLSFDEAFQDQVGAPACSSTDEVRVRFSKWAPFSKRNFANHLGRDCADSSGVTVFFHANAIALISATPGTKVDSLTVKNYQGVQFTFKAAQFVISTGTIETSRLLLNSTTLFPEGEGSVRDLIGRYFIDHVTCTVGSVTKAMLPVYRKFFAPYYTQRTMHTMRLETSASLQEKLGILAVMAHFEFEEPDGTGLVIFRRFLHDIQAGRVGRKDGQALSTLPAAVLGGLRTVYDLKVRGRRIPSSEARVTLRFDVEQKPEADSRIRLSDQLDVLGMPKLAMDWKRSPDESRSMHLFATYIDSFLKKSGLALDWSQGLLDSDDAWSELGGDCFHPMGGTRMGTSPATSVVDTNLQVHGISNLSVASCAVYPTGGSSNPTFTLMALTLRLAEYLKGK